LTVHDVVWTEAVSRSLENKLRARTSAAARFQSGFDKYTARWSNAPPLWRGPQLSAKLRESILIHVAVGTAPATGERLSALRRHVRSRASDYPTRPNAGDTGWARVGSTGTLPRGAQ